MVDFSQIKLKYVCGTTFTVANSAMHNAVLQYTVASSTPETGDLTVAPGATDTLYVHLPGALSLSLYGWVIATAGTALVACP